jgi:hypothetical protein
MKFDIGEFKNFVAHQFWLQWWILYMKTLVLFCMILLSIYQCFELEFQELLWKQFADYVLPQHKL